MTEKHSDSDSESWRWSRPPRTTPPVIDRRVLPNGEIEEWERTPTIPDDFIYDPVTHAYSAPGEPTEWNSEVYEENVRQILEEPHNAPPIPQEKLRVPAGTLDVPASWRKSLGRGPRQQLDLFAGQSEDDAAAEISPPEDLDQNDEETADE